MQDPHIDIGGSKTVSKHYLNVTLSKGERGRGLGLQREGRQFIGLWEEEMFGK